MHRWQHETVKILPTIFAICFKLIQRGAFKGIFCIKDGWVVFSCLLPWINRDNEIPDILHDAGSLGGFLGEFVGYNAVSGSKNLYTPHNILLCYHCNLLMFHYEDGC